jgi:hypothetical protein
MTAIKIPKTPMKAKENLKLDNSATYPLLRPHQKTKKTYT